MPKYQVVQTITRTWWEVEADTQELAGDVATSMSDVEAPDEEESDIDVTELPDTEIPDDDDEPDDL